LSEINSDEKNVITIEDPIEYNIDGISQIQVSNKKGLTFASGLRSLMRQDPDVMMVGEIRDAETAEIAIQAALTGHLVFSTLHTNDAAGAVSRLLEMGVENYLLASSLLGVLAQRLVRRVCSRCRAPVELPPEVIREIAAGTRETFQVFEGRGCEECAGTGYRGRSGIYELLLVSDTLKQLILERASSNLIREASIKQGMRALRDDGWRTVREGITTVGEVVRVTQEEI
jgi:type II secretory ATPase GspE/PulE/Tfp pilus assembly ATPase PilB-like protein